MHTRALTKLLMVGDNPEAHGKVITFDFRFVLRFKGAPKFYLG